MFGVVQIVVIVNYSCYLIDKKRKDLIAELVVGERPSKGS